MNKTNFLMQSLLTNILCGLSTNFPVLICLLVSMIGFSIFKKTWMMKTTKGTSRQNISQTSMNFRYAVAGRTWEILWYIVYMTSMMVRERPIARSKSFLSKKRVTSAINNWNGFVLKFQWSYELNILIVSSSFQIDCFA